jgi:hypothetical protein
MKTEDLIAALAADTTPHPPVGTLLARTLAGALCASALALMLVWGTRSDLAAAFGSAAVFKTLGPALGAFVALGLALALARPGASTLRGMAGLAGLLALAVLVFALDLWRGGLTGLVAALSTPSLFVCLLSIPVLALPLLGATLWALGSGAVLRPRLAGAVAGLAAGAGAAALYSLYCDKDMVLFVLPAYGVAIGFVALAGAVLGPRALKW